MYSKCLLHLSMEEICTDEAPLVLHKLMFIILIISRATLILSKSQIGWPTEQHPSIEKLQSTVAFITLCWFNNETTFFYLKQYLPSLSMQFVLWPLNCSSAKASLLMTISTAKKIKADPWPCHVSFLFKTTKILLLLGDIY